MKTFKHRNGTELVVIGSDNKSIAVPKEIFDKEYDPNYTDVVNVTSIGDSIETQAEPFPPFDSCNPARVAHVCGFDGRYLVTDDGVVLAQTTNRIISTAITHLGYVKITPYRGINEKQGGTVQVHRLVAQAFIPNPENKPQVNHIDGDKTNNDYRNLEWSTVSENHLHAFSTGLRNAALANFNPDEIKNIRQLLSEGVNIRAVAEQYNVPYNCIDRIKHKHTYRHVE
jgi:hypothetical protein